MAEEIRIFPLSEQGVQKAAVLFRDETGKINDTMILSALQGVMGELAGDDPDNPTAVRATVNDFVFLAGNPKGKGAEDLILCVQMPLLGAISGNKAERDGWEGRFAALYPHIQRFDRYAIKKEPDVFDRDRLEGYGKLLPEGFSVVPIDTSWAAVCQKTAWACDLVSGFPNAEDFVQKGIGFLVLNEAGEPVSGASSYSVYEGGIEIEIDTHPDYRRRKLALVVGARLILACLDRGLYPSWDAANLASVALSEKLGYHLDHHYYVWYLPEKDADGMAAATP